MTVSVESLSFRRRRFDFYIVQLILLLLYCNFYPGLISPLYYSHNSVPALVVAPAALAGLDLVEAGPAAGLAGSARRQRRRLR